MIPGRAPSELSDEDIRREVAMLLARGYVRLLAAREELRADENALAASGAPEATCPDPADVREEVA